VKSDEADQLIKLLQSFKESNNDLPLPPPPPTPEIKEADPYEDYKGVLVDGKPPAVSESFFSSKIFIMAASVAALVTGVVVYVLISL
jgi:hypothetical protein